MRKPRITFTGLLISSVVILLILGGVVLKGGSFFSRDRTFVMYFGGSASGLKKGAPVELKGVKVGEVTSIDLHYDPITDTIKVPVLAQIDLESITRADKGQATKNFLMRQVGKGLRAQLQFQHFATGQLLVELDFHPEEPVRLVRSGLPFAEIPTIPSAAVELAEALQGMPLRELTSRAAGGIGKAAKSPEIMETIHSMNLVLDEARKLTLSLNKGMEQAGTSEASLVYQLSQTLEKLSDAADSMRALSDYLNRHPDSMLRGKRASGGE